MRTLGWLHMVTGPPSIDMPMRAARNRAWRMIGLGSCAVATIPAVGLAFASWHVLVGIAVSFVYGALATTGGAIYIATGVFELRRLRALAPPAPPEARLLDRKR